MIFLRAGRFPLLLGILISRHVRSPGWQISNHTVTSDRYGDCWTSVKLGNACPPPSPRSTLAAAQPQSIISLSPWDLWPVQVSQTPNFFFPSNPAPPRGEDRSVVLKG
ncbi:hypothetical protein TNIN_107211 [Trichonephila inaurata madagascariensis]|uniref:Uncharacterized protein n=1 Tax=Trichonephila inaurata madagascariensis TaxID=2747483 RepID=A0A8X7BVS2_9ARAC|nr:hypothetical protein TNIN_107211 [Trichonephila inaurata madagascariensis]